MPSRPHRPSRAPAAPPLALVFALAAALGPARARAQCSVVPGEQGEISTWLVAGTLAAPTHRPPRPVDDQLGAALAAVAPGSLRPSQGGTFPAGGQQLQWTASGQPDARFDADAVLHGRGAREAFVGAELVAQAPARVQLFVGADDGMAVLLDGREVYRRAQVRDARDDDDRVPLSLAAGRHTLVFALHVNGGPMRLYARLVDDAFAPPAHVHVELPGVDDAACTALGTAALHVSAQRTARAADTVVALEARYPGGTARRASEAARELRVRIDGGAPGVPLRLMLDGGAAARGRIETTAPATAHQLHVEVVQGGAATEVRAVDLDVDPVVRAALVRAERVLGPLSEASPPAFLPLGSLTSARYVAERLASLVADDDGDAAHLHEEARTLDSLLDAIAAGRDPYAGRGGALRRGYRTDVDDTLQGYSLYVPPSYRGDHPFPLIVALHGLHGTAHRMLPVLFGLYDEHESHAHADRHLPPLPDARALIVAPFGFGDAGYRGPGEADVLRVVDEVRRAYRIDPERIYMTGLSMGGIGAAAVPLHHPDLFAAMAPLCGYHSYFVRNDTGGVRRPWELFLMEARSNALWAENGLHLPMYVVHGTRDRPVENSRVLVDRYTELHYQVESEWPDLGHNVWSTTYADGRIVPYFLRFRRDPAPRHVRFRSAGMRWRESYWVALDALAAPNAWGDVDATAEPSRLRVETHGVRALTLSPPAALFASGAATVPLRIDGDALSLTAGSPLSLARDEHGHWAAATRSVEPAVGPLRDALDGPVAVVYGTHDADERAMDRRVAEAWAHIRPGVRVRVPVLADDEVTDAFARAHTLVLVGSPRANGYLARIGAHLPIRVEGDAVVAGTQHFRGDEVGASFVAPNPEAPGRLVLVVTGTGPLGVWRSRFLPDLVPDFAVYDARVGPARGRVLLGPRAGLLAAGFFDRAGTVPTDTRDPYAPAQAASPAAGETGGGGDDEAR